ncbi:hypothetical protein GW17_00046581 [Ensete ventricosum]|nr:hypothetical protein GW17_00046581 [Ensete ventricosum]
MAMGRGSRNGALLLSILLIACSPLNSLAATHVVGDSQGWGFSMSYAKWADGKSFAPGDTLCLSLSLSLSLSTSYLSISALGFKQ